VTPSKPRLLVTRPAAQSARLCALLEAAGYEAVRLPAIEILETEKRYELEAATDELDSYDLAVFVSVNAVQKGVEFVLDRREWPEQTAIATVGARSAEALLPYGLSTDHVPEHRFNSEALLALDELQDMTGQRVVIFRGNGGREYLHDTLLERGAEVDYVEVYRRACPVVDAAAILKLLQPGYLDYITVTSNETLQNLFDMAGAAGQPLLCDVPLVVVSRRQSLLARQLGFRREPLLAANASDEAIVAAVKGDCTPSR
jgi:uroporphyrinogen-III synthase